MIGKGESSSEIMRLAEASQMKPSKKGSKKLTKAAKEAIQLRQHNQQYYDSHNVEPMTLDGRVFRSRLEALWYEQFRECDRLAGVECTRVPVWIDGPYGKFLSDYTPDLTISLLDGSQVFVELKPNHEVAIADDRQKRALKLNPNYKFVVIGGYPYSKRGVTLRMLTGGKELVHQYVKVCDVLKFLECECYD